MKMKIFIEMQLSVVKMTHLNMYSIGSDRRLSGCQTNDKVGQFRLPIKSTNKNLLSVMQKSAEFVCH